MNILEEIAVKTRERIAQEKRQVPQEVLLEKIKERESLEQSGEKKRPVRTFLEALQKPGMSYICEVKKASPSKGLIAPDFPYTAIAKEYEDSGASAISCLTEEDHFDGNVDYLKKIRTITELPILRKDFMIDPYQFYEAKAIGADAVLLIAAILDDAQMKDFYQLSKELELDALVEVHDEKELERAMKIDADIIGVNNRNLKDFTISLDTTVQLSKLVPEDKVLVAESGILQDADVELLKECGVDAFLIGRALMEAEHPKEVAKRWKA